MPGFPSSKDSSQAQAGLQLLQRSGSKGAHSLVAANLCAELRAATEGGRMCLPSQQLQRTPGSAWVRRGPAAARATDTSRCPSLGERAVKLLRLLSAGTQTGPPLTPSQVPRPQTSTVPEGNLLIQPFPGFRLRALRSLLAAPWTPGALASAVPSRPGGAQKPGPSLVDAFALNTRGPRTAGSQLRDKRDEEDPQKHDTNRPG